MSSGSLKMLTREIPQEHMAQWIKAFVTSSHIPKRVWVQYPVKAVENLHRGN